MLPENLTSVAAPLAAKPPLKWINILFLTLNPLAAAVFTPLYLMSHGLSWGLLAFLIITYTISNMVITVGYHRYFSHRTYSVHPVIEQLFVFFGSGSFQGSILAWCTDHRRHHREVDSHDDPYSRSKGFWYSHILWMFRHDPHPEAELFPKDLTKNPLIVWQHNYYLVIAIFVGYILPGIIGYFCGFGFWGGVIIGGALRITLSQHSTFLINSAAHTFGTRPYTDKNSARDSVIMAFLTFGEGYHNYHHYFQLDYRNGIRWYQWDPTKWMITTLAFFGLATKLKKARKEEIFKARLAMEEQLLLAHLESQIAAQTQDQAHVLTLRERAMQMKTRIVDAQAKMRTLHDDYLAAKKTFVEKHMRRMRRAEFKIAKIEFKAAYTQWRTFRKAVRRAGAA